MKNVFGIVVLMLALVGVKAGAEETVEVKVGESRLLDVGEMKRIALGDMNLAKVKTVGKTQLEVKGEAPGKTMLLVWTKSGERQEYKVTVTGEAKEAKQGGGEPTPDETLTLKVGETRPLSFPGVTRVAVADPSISDIRMGEGQKLLVQARKAGETTLLVWTGEGRKAYRIIVQG